MLMISIEHLQKITKHTSNKRSKSINKLSLNHPKTDQKVTSAQELAKTQKKSSQIAQKCIQGRKTTSKWIPKWDPKSKKIDPGDPRMTKDCPRPPFWSSRALFWWPMASIWGARGLHFDIKIDNLLLHVQR